MPSGIQIRDENNVLVFDETSPVVKFLGSASIGASYTGEQGSGTIVDGRFTAYPQHTPFYARIDGGFEFGGIDANISISGNTLTWTYPYPASYNNGTMYNRPNQTFVYGIL
jgi:hypothetical protein